MFKIDFEDKKMIAELESISNKADSVSEKAAVFARQIIQHNLTEELGDGSAAHFQVSISPSGDGWMVIVSGDEIAVFIVEGTSPHTISVSPPEAMPVGGGAFATSVSHPGFPGKKEIIQKVVIQSAMQAWGLALSV